MENFGRKIERRGGLEGRISKTNSGKRSGKKTRIGI
jgi:hypothetical protein